MGKIVVTGAKGGTGASIVDVLRERGYDVLSTGLLPSVEEHYKQFDLRDAAASKLPGTAGNRQIHQGGKFEIDVAVSVSLSSKECELRLGTANVRIKRSKRIGGG